MYFDLFFPRDNPLVSVTFRRPWRLVQLFMTAIMSYLFESIQLQVIADTDDSVIALQPLVLEIDDEPILQVSSSWVIAFTMFLCMYDTCYMACFKSEYACRIIWRRR